MSAPSEETLQRLSLEIQNIAEDHLNALFEQLDDEGGEELQPSNSVAAYAPFCGCTTCIVREVLMVTAEKVEALVLLANAPAPRDESQWWKDKAADENAVSLRSDASDTSAEAAARYYPKSGSDRLLVLETLVELNGATDEELQSFLGMPANTERPRRRELVMCGYAEATSQRRATSTGNDATVWVATEKGYQLVENGVDL